jgi:hypothetical protein
VTAYTYEYVWSRADFGPTVIHTGASQPRPINLEIYYDHDAERKRCPDLTLRDRRKRPSDGSDQHAGNCRVAGSEPLISKNPAWHMQASASTLGYQDRLGDARA